MKQDSSPLWFFSHIKAGIGLSNSELLLFRVPFQGPDVLLNLQDFDSFLEMG